MGWGVDLLGFASVVEVIDDIQVRLDDDAVYVVGTNVEYAVYVEFGTRYQDAQPFLFPAAREAERNMDRIVAGSTSLEGAVKRVALFIEREASERAPVDTGRLRASIAAERVR